MSISIIDTFGDREARIGMNQCEDCGRWCYTVHSADWNRYICEDCFQAEEDLPPEESDDEGIDRLVVGDR